MKTKNFKKILLIFVSTVFMPIVFLSACGIEEDNIHESVTTAAVELSQETQALTTESSEDEKVSPPVTDAVEIEFDDPVKTPHYVDNVPAHASIIPAVPINVVINFDFDIISASEIKITGGDGQLYNSGDTLIDNNRLGMRIEMKPESPDGTYIVEYSACWPDGSCHEGMFQFAIDRSLRAGFTDLKGQQEIIIDMQNLMFDPQDIIINKGTTLKWINRETVEHYVNTDPHPGHNYFPDQNSTAITKDEIFSLIFDFPGYYPYHCSAHPETMKAVIIVE